MHKKDTTAWGKSKCIYNVGSPTIDYLKSINYISREELSRDLNIQFKDTIFIVTYHPTTLGIEESDNGKSYYLLDEYPSATIIITLSNADNGGSKINTLLRDFAADHLIAKFSALGHLILQFTR